MSWQNKKYKRGDLVAVGMKLPTAKSCKQCPNNKSRFFRPLDYQARVREGTHAHEPLKSKHD